MLTILLTAYIIMLIIPLLCIAYKRYHDHYTERRTASRTQYQEHIDNLVNELFPPATHASTHTSDLQEATVQYQETKRKMIADIRKYFNRRKMKIETLHSVVEISDPPDDGTLSPVARDMHMQRPVNLLVDTLSGDHYNFHLVRYEQGKHLTQPVLSLWVTAEIYNFASSSYICLARDHSDSRDTVSKLTIEGKIVDAEAARRSDEDWIRMIRRTLFLLSTAEHRHRDTPLTPHDTERPPAISL